MSPSAADLPNAGLPNDAAQPAARRCALFPRVVVVILAIGALSLLLDTQPPTRAAALHRHGGSPGAPQAAAPAAVEAPASTAAAANPADTVAPTPAAAAAEAPPAAAAAVSPAVLAPAAAAPAGSESGAASDFAVLSVGEPLPALSAARAALRERTNTSAACGGVIMFDSIRAVPPLRQCTPAQLSAALSAAKREAQGAPLLVPGCALEVYEGERACALLAAAGGLSLIGDSLIRHIVQTLRETLAGDYVGFLSGHMGGNAVLCQCEGAFDDGHLRRFPGDHTSEANTFCRLNSAAFLPTGSWPSCPSWVGQGDFLAAYAWGVTHRAGMAIAVLQGGLHSPALDEAAADTWFNTGRSAGSQQQIYFSLHAPGINKPVKYLDLFGDNATLAFNEMIRRRAEAHGAVYFDAYAITVGEISIDGVHYFHSVNFAMTQLLLNLIAAMVRQKNATAAALPLAERVRMLRLEHRRHAMLRG